jgi:hypothetical protein
LSVLSRQFSANEVNSELMLTDNRQPTTDNRTSST